MSPRGPIILVGCLLAFGSSPTSVGAWARPGQDEAREAFSAGRFEEASSLLRPRAEAGEAAAQFLLGLMYRDGLGIPRDISEAKRWLSLAAAQGYDGARFVLGEIELVDGSASAATVPTRPLGRSGDETEAVPADTPVPRPEPSPHATLRDEQPRPEPRPPVEPVPAQTGPLTGRAHWLELAALQGTSSAQYDLARLYESGRGAPHDPAKALAWYRKAAEQGHTQAQVQLAYLLAAGESVPRDVAESTRFYRMAAEGGDARAQFSLAMLLQAGGEADPVEALVWLERARAGSTGQLQATASRERDKLAANLSQDQLDQVRDRLAGR